MNSDRMREIERKSTEREKEINIVIHVYEICGAQKSFSVGYSILYNYCIYISQ